MVVGRKKKWTVSDDDDDDVGGVVAARSACVCVRGTCVSKKKIKNLIRKMKNSPKN